MATKNTATANRTDPIDVDGNRALALLGAWQGVYHFFDGRVEKWDYIAPTEDNPDGGVIAHGFTIDSTKANPEDLLSDISNRDRRVNIFPAYAYMQGETPAPFTTPQQMTNFMVSNLKGSVEESTAKTPAYVRTAVQNYKASNGLKTRRGRRKTVIKLDLVDGISPQELQNISPEGLQKLLAAIQEVHNGNSKAPAEDVSENIKAGHNKSEKSAEANAS